LSMLWSVPLVAPIFVNNVGYSGAWGTRGNDRSRKPEVFEMKRIAYADWVKTSKPRQMKRDPRRE
jgi:hypothetical protein